MVFASSRKSGLAKIQVLGELLDLACSLRQKISFFRKVLGDFLFENFWSDTQKWGRGHFVVQKKKGWWFSEAFHWDSEANHS